MPLCLDDKFYVLVTCSENLYSRICPGHQQASRWIWILSGRSIVQDRASSVGSDGWTLAIKTTTTATQITPAFLFYFVFCFFCFFLSTSRCFCLCPRLTVARAALLPFPTQENQLVVTSCRRRDVSSCCHRKVAPRTSECKRRAEKPLRGCHRATDSASAIAAEPTVFGDMAEQGYSSW